MAWAARLSAYPGEQRSGDAFLVAEGRGSVLVVVIDALGHGPEAADVADLARSTAASVAGQGPRACLEACHTALRGSRGAAIVAASVTAAGDQLTWLGVGNVEALVLPPQSRATPAAPRSVVPRGGVVGGRLPPLRESVEPLGEGALLVLATDGIAQSFRDDVRPTLPLRRLATRLHARHAVPDDDALVFVSQLGPPAFP